MSKTGYDYKRAQRVVLGWMLEQNKNTILHYRNDDAIVVTNGRIGYAFAADENCLDFSRFAVSSRVGAAMGASADDVDIFRTREMKMFEDSGGVDSATLYVSADRTVSHWVREAKIMRPVFDPVMVKLRAAPGIGSRILISDCNGRPVGFMFGVRLIEREGGCVNG